MSSFDRTILGFVAFDVFLIKMQNQTKLSNFESITYFMYLILISVYLLHNLYKCIKNEDSK